MKLRLFFIAISFLFYVIILSSCLSPNQGIKGVNLNDGSLVVDEQNDGEMDSGLDRNVILIENDLDNRELIDGYRVKVASKNSLDDANLIEKKIVEKIDAPVYIDFIVDKYMVYVGDCQNKAEADELKGKLKALGFSKIYSVPKRVYKKEKYSTEKISYTTDNEVVKSSDNKIEKTKVNERVFGEKILGYRVQIFAGLNKDNAQKIKEIAKDKTDKNIYILLKENLFKVQIGDLKSRIEAEELRDKLEKEMDVPGAFIVNTLIFSKVKNSLIKSSGTNFYIQIGAYSSSSNANKLLEMASVYGYENSTVSEDGDLHKVLIGGYDTREGAETEKKKLISLGFEGAWILER